LGFWVVFRDDVSMMDLAALTAKEGVEFAMFTRGSERAGQQERSEMGSKDNGRTPKEKFDALLPVEVSSDEVRTLGHGDGFKARVLGWLERKKVFGGYRNIDRQWNIEFNKKSVRNVLGHSAGEGKVALLEQVPALIKKGIYLEDTVKEDGTISHIFAAKANLDGKPHIIGFIVRGTSNGKRYYDHAIRIEEGWAETKTVQSDTAAANPPETPTSIYNILKKHLAVNT
jgi:hypothetical protein